jgi:hypothetical protein
MWVKGGVSKLNANGGYGGVSRQTELEFRWHEEVESNAGASKYARGNNFGALRIKNK